MSRDQQFECEYFSEDSKVKCPRVLTYVWTVAYMNIGKNFSEIIKVQFPNLPSFLLPSIQYFREREREEGYLGRKGQYCITVVTAFINNIIT